MKNNKYRVVYDYCDIILHVITQHYIFLLGLHSTERLSQRRGEQRAGEERNEFMNTIC